MRPERAGIAQRCAPRQPLPTGVLFAATRCPQVSQRTQGTKGQKAAKASSAPRSLQLIEEEAYRRDDGVEHDRDTRGAAARGCAHAATTRGIYICPGRTDTSHGVAGQQASGALHSGHARRKQQCHLHGTRVPQWRHSHHGASTWPRVAGLYATRAGCASTVDSIEWWVSW